MTREEFMNKLQECYFGNKTAFNEIIEYFDTLQNSLQTQCQSLQTKIDEAIDYIKPKLKLKNENGFPYPLFKRAHINHILKILERTDK